MMRNDLGTARACAGHIWSSVGMIVIAVIHGPVSIALSLKHAEVSGRSMLSGNLKFPIVRGELSGA